MTDTAVHDPALEANRRQPSPDDRPAMAGVPVRPEDIEPTQGVHRVATLLRAMAGMLVLLMALQVFFGVTGSVAISYGVLFAEAVRLLIFAGLLWAAADLAELYVKTHYDTRASRILMARLTYRVSEALERLEARADDGAGRRS
jgi:hypothetical protein